MRENMFFFTKWHEGTDYYGTSHFNGKIIWTKYILDQRPLAYTYGQAMELAKDQDCDMHWYSLVEDSKKETQVIMRIAHKIETKILDRATFTDEDEKIVTRALAEVLIVLRDIIPLE